MPRKVIKLDFEEEYDFLLVAVICGFKDYRFIFELNQLLSLNLFRKDDVVLPAGKPGSSTRHSYYFCDGPDHESYHVISNRDKSGTGHYIPELKNIDFFVLITGAYGNIDVNEFVKTIRSVEMVTGAYEAQPQELKSAEAFLLFTES